MSWMVKNSKGNPDAMLSFSVVAVFIASIAILLPMFSSIKIGSVSLNFVKPDTTLVLGFLSSTLGAYVARRNNMFAKPDQGCAKCDLLAKSPPAGSIDIPGKLGTILNETGMLK